MDLTAHNDDFLKQMGSPRKEVGPRSLLDLIELSMFDLELAAWFVARVAGGDSYITGSGPGGIGKSTTMQSLLSFVPDDRRFTLALPGKVAAIDGLPRCVITNELSDHPPPTYLWGQDLRDFFTLARHGHTLVGNVHADDLDETHGQIVRTNEVPESLFRAVNLLVFICLEGGNPKGGRIKDTTTRRVVNRVYYTDGASGHELVYTPESGLNANAPRNPAEERRCRSHLQESLQSPDRSLEGVRSRFLAWKENHG